MQLRALEAEAYPFLSTSAGSGIREGIEKWKAEWKAMSGHSHYGTERQDSAIDGLGIKSTEEETAPSVNTDSNSDPFLHPAKGRIIITRPGLVAQHSSDPFVDEGSPLVNGNTEIIHQKGVDADMTKPAPETLDVTAVRGADQGADQGAAKRAAKTADDDKPPAQEASPKTPWEELWEGLAAFSGMHDD